MYSPCAAGTCKHYPIHLKIIIDQYQKALAYDKPQTLKVFQVNHQIQKDIIGTNAPIIGKESSETPRDSTREENKKNGVALVERKKNGSVYMTIKKSNAVFTTGVDGKQSKGSPKKRINLMKKLGVL